MSDICQYTIDMKDFQNYQLVASLKVLSKSNKKLCMNVRLPWNSQKRTR